MKLRQNLRHFASQKALEVPGLRDVVHDKLVDIHTSIFLDKATEARRDEREAHLDGFFDASMEMYLVALQSGLPEAQAREITHIVANFDFYNHGWTEMMEFPGDELRDHYDRHADFFDEHDITIDNPLGAFQPADGIPDAPATPEKLADADFENAAAGFEDDVYVETDDGIQKGGVDEPDDVDPEDSPFAE
ncbi:MULTISPECIES: DUF6149 family protein [Halobacterium]|uniref:Uncharacterized protein n=4 Tax=Halobacterium salinarum TaxID=2242 RepID=Q9HP52_HALSA|nr:MULTISPECIES: DUF6149 family protein [Halobacterium]AAG20018.1 hypothetical protein VNG_1798H [Halobacterium salinarum NRC-1]MBB6089027.1 hypothetical protein [Halobacterium salinarum]MDL0119692.1 DUF6149 family protein [Halobacterium salinarum]MDL0122935.1 DUF6149 family protein [Halobacterium salinarum]MDL0128131.1 DUF6149 family protein [Halobacterium salinarum]